jgi:hypothetical protein
MAKTPGGMAMMLKALGIDFDPETFRQVGGAVMDVRDRLLRIEAKLDAERARENFILRKYGHHLGTCSGFPATSEANLTRDCSCGFSKLLEGAEDGRSGSGSGSGSSGS